MKKKTVMELKYHHSAAVAAVAVLIAVCETLDSLISVSIIRLTLSVYFLQAHLPTNCME